MNQHKFIIKNTYIYTCTLLIVDLALCVKHIFNLQREFGVVEEDRRVEGS